MHRADFARARRSSLFTVLAGSRRARGNFISLPPRVSPCRWGADRHSSPPRLRGVEDVVSGGHLHPEDGPPEGAHGGRARGARPRPSARGVRARAEPVRALPGRRPEPRARGGRARPRRARSRSRRRRPLVPRPRAHHPCGAHPGAARSGAPRGPFVTPRASAPAPGAFAADPSDPLLAGILSGAGQASPFGAAPRTPPRRAPARSRVRLARRGRRRRGHERGTTP